LQNLSRPHLDAGVVTAKQCAWNRPSRGETDDNDGDGLVDSFIIMKPKRHVVKKNNSIMLDEGMTRRTFSAVSHADLLLLEKRNDDPVRNDARAAFFSALFRPCAASELWGDGKKELDQKNKIEEEEARKNKRKAEEAERTRTTRSVTISKNK